MSNLKLVNGDDFPDAAAKHLDDATVLLSAQRYDGVAYLSGYVVECSLKTLILLWLPRTTPAETVNELPLQYRRHDLRNLSTAALKLAPSTVSGSILRYALRPVKSEWTETMRYHSPGTTKDQATEWLAEAEQIYAGSVAQMRLDGAVF